MRLEFGEAGVSGSAVGGESRGPGEPEEDDSRPPPVADSAALPRRPKALPAAPYGRLRWRRTCAAERGVSEDMDTGDAGVAIEDEEE